MKHALALTALFLALVLTVSAQDRASMKGSAWCSAKKSAATHLVTLNPNGDSGPSHSYDALKYTLDLDLYDCHISPYPNSFSGSVIVKFKALADLDQVKLNARGYSLVIDSVGLAAGSFVHAADTLTLFLSQTLLAGQVAEARIFYHHKNVIDNAFYASGGFVFTDCEPEGARYWFPCWDQPSDKALFELFARVKSTVRLGSNGTLADSTLNGDELTYHWISNQNVATYLMVISSKVNYQLKIDYWHKLSNPSDSIPLRYYYNLGEDPTPVTSIMPDLTTWFSQNFIEHPFDKNGFATLNSEFSWGGMENQTLTSLCPGCWSESLAAHEFAHQWFGDMITCATWADIWLNEGFATWSEAFWYEMNGGYSAYKSDINGDAAYYLQYNSGWALSNPAWATNTPPVNTLFDYSITYMKGACVLHQLRYVLGDSLFFETLQQYCADTNFKYQSATIADFNAKVNAVTGSNYDWFFNAWIFQPNHPVYQNYYDFENVGGGQWKVNFRARQTQTNAPYFPMVLELRVQFADASDTLLRFMNETNGQLFGWTFGKEPVSVTFDPRNEIVLKSASTIVGFADSPGKANSVTLFQNTPNPTANSTSLHYSIPSPARVTIEITDLPGAVLLRPLDAWQDAGEHRLAIDCSDLASGTYLIRLTSDNTVRVKKMIKVR